MADPIKTVKKMFTYSDYASWPDDKRYEVIAGEAYSMAPGANDMHQDASTELVYQFRAYLKDKRCKVYHTPFDVILPEEGETFDNASNVVQPDVFIVCNKDKITRKGCYGAPDLVVEILSPSSVKRDIKEKRKLYQRFHVKEYWIVDPVHKSVQIYKLDEQGKYSFPETHAEDDKIKVGIFNDDLEIDLAVIFAE